MPQFAASLESFLADIGTRAFRFAEAGLRNRDDALARAQALVDAALAPPVPRRPTKPTRGSQQRRVDAKVKRGQTKAQRQAIRGE